MTAVVLFRSDLRLYDNPALDAAIKTNEHVLPIYIYDQDCSRPMGAASKWWLHHSLSALKKSFKTYDTDIVLRKGNTLEILKELHNEIKLTHIFWHDRYDQEERKQDKEIRQYFESINVKCQPFNGALLFQSKDFQTGDKTPFKVFTAFWKYCTKNGSVEEPLELPSSIKFDADPKVHSDNLDSWKLLPTKPDWAKGFRDTWVPGEQGAQNLFKKFLSKKLKGYKSGRDHPAALAISDLSPHIHWGEISLRQLWHEVRTRSILTKCAESGECFLRQLCWKEFNHYTLYHNPQMITQPLKEKFKHITWNKNNLLFKAWCNGQTGYPLIDAGMRQLWKTGYMHNRVRLVVASFLTKNLLISWQEGEKWFWDTLVDADLASNTFNWQWVAGCGYDAAPYFRVFNPILQSKKFDTKGKYIRQWIPELRNVNNKFIHEPWLSQKKIKKYPDPVVDFYKSRDEALNMFYSLF